MPTPSRTPHATAYAHETSYLDPTCMYTYAGFIRASGLNRNRFRQARQQGIELKTLTVGRRKFVRGADGIEFIESVAARAAEASASA